MTEVIPLSWLQALGHRLDAVDLPGILRDVAVARQKVRVHPRDDQIFAALDLTPFGKVKAVILGQDPYYRDDQACGLAFSVTKGDARPLSLRRIVAAVENDLHCHVPKDATLEPWARNGVLLLNTALTVAEDTPNSHRRLWSPFTDALLETLAAQSRPTVFLLRGAEAKLKYPFVAKPQHLVLTSAHPAARLSRTDPNTLANSHPFSRAKAWKPDIEWSLG